MVDDNNISYHYSHIKKHGSVSRQVYYI